MLWFQQFMEPITNGCFLLLSEPKQPYQAGKTPPWATTQPIEEKEEAEVSPFALENNDDDDNELEFAFVGDGDDDEADTSADD
jgi:hypothetical protein